MGKRIPLRLLAFFFALLATSAAGASSPALYVHNRPYAKPLLVYKGVLYAVVDDIFPVIRLRLSSRGRVLCGASPGYAKEPCPEDGSGAFLFVDGKPLTSGVLVRRGRIWVSLPVLASATGNAFKFNRETGIADLMSLPRFRIEVAKGGEETGKTQDSSGKKTGEEKKEDPLTVIWLDRANMESLTSVYAQNPRTYEVRLAFRVKNISQEPVKGITATLRYLDGYGKPLAEHAFAIGTLQPGQTTDKDDYFLNSSGIYIKPDVVLDWEGKKKE